MPVANDTRSPTESENGSVLNFGEVGVILWLIFVVMLQMLAKLVFRNSAILQRCLPESCVLIVVGIIHGLLTRTVFQDAAWHVKLSHYIFFNFLLPPIVISAGFNIPMRLFYDNITPIAVFAILGTVCNMVLIGGLLYLTVSVPLIGTDLRVSIDECLMFASIISSVDPVSVIALFEEMHIEKVLYIIILGESLFNDAAAVILFQITSLFVEKAELDKEAISYLHMSLAVLSILIGPLLGFLFGILGSWLSRFTNVIPRAEVLFLLLVPYAAYIFSEGLAMSGILPAIICSMFMRRYVELNLAESLTSAQNLLMLASDMADSLMFFFIGLEFTRLSFKGNLFNHRWDWLFTIWTILFCLLVRFFVVIAISKGMNLLRVTKLSWSQILVLAYVGVRGGIAISLAITIHSKDRHKADTFIGTTMLLVIFTIFVLGTTTKPVLRCMRVRLENQPIGSLAYDVHVSVINHLMAAVEEIRGVYGPNKFREKLEHVHERFFKKWFLRDQRARDVALTRALRKATLEMMLEFIRLRTDEGRVSSKLTQKERIRELYGDEERTSPWERSAVRCTYSKTSVMRGRNKPNLCRAQRPTCSDWKDELRQAALKFELHRRMTAAVLRVEQFENGTCFKVRHRLDKARLQPDCKKRLSAPEIVEHAAQAEETLLMPDLPLLRRTTIAGSKVSELESSRADLGRRLEAELHRNLGANNNPDIAISLSAESPPRLSFRPSLNIEPSNSLSAGVDRTDAKERSSQGVHTQSHVVDLTQASASFAMTQLNQQPKLTEIYYENPLTSVDTRSFTEALSRYSDIDTNEIAKILNKTIKSSPRK